MERNFRNSRTSGLDGTMCRTLAKKSLWDELEAGLGVMNGYYQNNSSCISTVNKAMAQHLVSDPAVVIHQVVSFANTVPGASQQWMSTAEASLCYATGAPEAVATNHSQRPRRTCLADGGIG